MSDSPDPENADTKKDPGADQTSEKTAAEPIDAEFEPAEDQSGVKQSADADDALSEVKSSGPGWGALATTGAFASLAGAAMAIVATGSSGVDTAKFAPSEIQTDVRKIEQIQNDLNQRVQKIWGTVSELEARQVGATETLEDALDARKLGEEELRAELTDLTAQLEFLLGPAELSPDATNAAQSDPNNGAEDGEAVAPTTPAPLQHLMNRITTLEARLEEGDETLQTPKQLQLAVKAIENRIEILETADEDLKRASQIRAEALAALQTQLQAANLTLKSLKDDVEGLGAADVREPTAAPATIKPGQPDEKAESAAPSDSSTKKMAEASLALANLEADADRGKPFSSALDRLIQVMPDDKDVLAIRPIARRGAPTLAALTNSFEEQKKPLLKRAKTSNGNDGWGWIRQALDGVVEVRKTSGEGVSDTSLLHQMSKQLEARDLAAAIELGEQLDQSVSVELQDWMKNAKLRLALNTHTDAVRQKILSNSGLSQQTANQEDGNLNSSNVLPK